MRFDFIGARGDQEKWSFRWEQHEKRFADLSEASEWADYILRMPILNEEIYLVVAAYFEVGDDGKVEILNWIRSEGGAPWGEDGWDYYVDRRRTRLSVRRLPKLIEADEENRKRFCLTGIDEPLLELEADEVIDPWYRGLLRRIRTEELKRLRATLPVASGESRPASRL